MRFPAINLFLPDWIEALFPNPDEVYESQEARMGVALKLAGLNIDYETGGPFGAAIFNIRTHQLLAVGVNRVVPSHCSVAHAEMVAMMVGEQILGAFDFGSAEGAAYELVTSTEPCAMCLGAIPWSGLRRVVCGARGEDACAVGFDEGNKPDNWVTWLERKGISVVRDVCRTQAFDILTRYHKQGGLIYNPRRAMVPGATQSPDCVV